MFCYYIFMLRATLTLFITVLLCFVLGLAALLIWGAQQAEYQFQRSQLAHDALEAYMQLSLDAYHHFKILADVLLLDNGIISAYVVDSRRDLFETLEKVKTATRKEIEFTEGALQQEERKELDRLAVLQQLLNISIDSFDEIQRLQQQGEHEAAWKLLTTVRKKYIDMDFRPLIDTAIAEERLEAEVAERQTVKLTMWLTQLATIISIIAVLFSVGVGFLLLRSIKAPMDALLRGTRIVAKGDLTHRLTIKGRGEFAHLADYFNNMTDELARQRAKLLDAHAQLEEKVAIRTEELHEANTELVKADQIRRQFFADISHELRTPLTIIRGEAEVTLRGRDKDVHEYQTALSRVADLAGHLSKLVDDLLFLARSESTSIRLDWAPVAVSDLLTAIAEDARMLSHTKEISIEVEYDDSQKVIVHGDYRRLKQLLLILIDNACRYSQPGGNIIIGLQADRPYACVIVRDNGIGIPNEDIDVIFERFYRGEQARQLTPGGLGLGLPLAKSIVEAHQGHIEVTSAPNQGTTVVIKLPMITVAEEQHAHFVSGGR